MTGSRFSATTKKGALLIAGVLAGVVFLSGMDIATEATSTTAFCLSCHEMQAPYDELAETVHYNNASGVRVECRDCHVPRDTLDKYVAKFQAVDDIYGHFVTGVISTPEKYEAHRGAMAETVWKRMEANDSMQCRNCHSFDAMDFDEQGKRPSRKHPKAMERGATCIECHKGVAHQLPKDFAGDD